MTTGDSLGGAERGRNSPGVGSSPTLPIDKLRKLLRTFDKLIARIDLVLFIAKYTQSSRRYKELASKREDADDKRCHIRSLIKSRSIPKEYQ